MAETRIRIEIGFEGGQIVSALTSAHLVDELEGLLSAGNDGAFALDAEDGSYTVVLRRVLYLKRYARESHVGFGTL